MEVYWEIFELYPIWAVWWGSWLEISRQTPNRQSRRGGGWKVEWKGTRGLRWGFPREFSVVTDIGKVGGCVVGNLNRPQLGYVIRVVVVHY